MLPKKATDAQKGKLVAEGTSQTRRVTRARAQSMPGIMLQSESSATPPPPEELRAAATPVRGTPLPPRPLHLNLQLLSQGRRIGP